jgi:hypothetical protein
MAGIPPNKPQNPYKLPADAHQGVAGTVGMTEGAWNGSVKEWLKNHPAFERENYTADGQPADGSFQSIWDKVKAIQAFLTQPPGPHNGRNHPRRALRAVVQQSGLIQNAVCLSLGQITWKSKVEYATNWVQQCGMFLAMCQLFEEKQGMRPGSLSKVFQDPCFEVEDRWLLEKLGGHIIVEHPAANDVMGQGSFVYAPRFSAHYMTETFLAPGLEPELLYTNTIHGTVGTLTWPIVNSYLYQVYSSGSPTPAGKAVYIYETLKRFIETHEGILYSCYYSEDEAVEEAFYDHSFYLRKRQPATSSNGHQNT